MSMISKLNGITRWDLSQKKLLFTSAIKYTWPLLLYFSLLFLDVSQTPKLRSYGNDSDCLEQSLHPACGGSLFNNEISNSEINMIFYAVYHKATYNTHCWPTSSQQVTTQRLRYTNSRPNIRDFLTIYPKLHNPAAANIVRQLLPRYLHHLLLWQICQCFR